MLQDSKVSPQTIFTDKYSNGIIRNEEKNLTSVWLISLGGLSEGTLETTSAFLLIPKKYSEQGSSAHLPGHIW